MEENRVGFWLGEAEFAADFWLSECTRRASKLYSPGELSNLWSSLCQESSGERTQSPGEWRISETLNLHIFGSVALFLVSFEP